MIILKQYIYTILDGLPPNMVPTEPMGYNFVSRPGGPLIKTEIVDQAPPCTLAGQPAFPPNGAGQGVNHFMAPQVPSPFSDQLLDFAEGRHPHMANGGFGANPAVASPLNVMVTEQAQVANLSTAKSPAHFSNAPTSPHIAGGAFGGQANNVPESNFSPAASPFNAYSPAPSPASQIAGTFSATTSR